MSSIADTLIDAGHQVTILHPFLDENSKKYVTSKANRIFIPISKEIGEMYFNRNKKIWEQQPLGDTLAATIISVNVHALICDGVFSDNNTMTSLATEGFNVGIAELFGVCGFGLVEALRIPQMIAVTATGISEAIAEIFNIPITPSYIPATISAFSDRMTFLQRMVNFFWHHISKPFQRHFILKCYLVGQMDKVDPASKEMFAKHGYEFDLFKIAKEKINYLLVNIDEYLDIARPVSQKVKYIGGIALGKPGKLDKYFEKILQRSSNGTIVISFGTLASTSIMPKTMKTAIINGVKVELKLVSLPEYTFIWKVDESDLSLDAGVNNLVTTKWLPQRELLSKSLDSLKLSKTVRLLFSDHPSVKAFVSHAGLNSVLESTKSGTPTIFVPIFADQFKVNACSVVSLNAALVQRKNTTIVIQKERLFPKKSSRNR
uniref:glucuronosyltransferase n=1 Tax=Heterorhabditis bacteriophora TaxID=37862 RepID=A0A1I7XFH7_HETBA